MSLSNRFPDRGSIGPTPAMTTRADETYLDFITDLRGTLMIGKAKDIHPQANAAIEAAGLEFEATHESVEAIRSVVRREVPEAAVWARTYRSTQEAFWNRVAESYRMREDEFLRMLEDSDKRGPGSVTWDPDYVYPEYSKVETHRQRDGYVGHPLVGIEYDYGTRVFANDFSEDDDPTKARAEDVQIPKDGKVERIMDVACSVGRFACHLKNRFPDAEVWGSDISSSMVRYAHYRAIQKDIDVHFIQKAGEDLDELPENHYDLVTMHILFHEAPTPVVDRTIANVYRMLRPGGTFYFSDFPTLNKSTSGFQYTNFLGAIDSADNSEPYAPEFANSNVEEKLRKQGFTLRNDETGEYSFVRVCDKPV